MIEPKPGEWWVSKWCHPRFIESVTDTHVKWKYRSTSKDAYCGWTTLIFTRDRWYEWVAQTNASPQPLEPKRAKMKEREDRRRGQEPDPE